ncbi:Holliday junction resolvase RuvX [Patescibacteria group bacterium]
MKYIGIDFGLKRIGIAISDKEGKIAFPRDIIENKKDKIFKYLEQLILEEGVEYIILGLPKSLQGRDTEITEKVQAFSKKLEENIDIPIVFENEMLTTKIAKQSNIAKDKVDASSAALILQAYLDRKNMLQ